MARMTHNLLGYADARGYAYCGPCGTAWEDEDRKLNTYSVEPEDRCELCGGSIIERPAPESFEGSEIVEQTVCRIF